MIVVRSSIKSIKLIATLQGQDSHYIHYQPTGSILTKSAQSDTNLLQESTIKIQSNHYRFICMLLVSFYFFTLLVDPLHVPQKQTPLTTDMGEIQNLHNFTINGLSRDPVTYLRY